jgi:hypothetical protein
VLLFWVIVANACLEYPDMHFNFLSYLSYLQHPHIRHLIGHLGFRRLHEHFLELRLRLRPADFRLRPAVLRLRRIDRRRVRRRPPPPIPSEFPRPSAGELKDGPGGEVTRNGCPYNALALWVTGMSASGTMGSIYILYVYKNTAKPYKCFV